MYACGHAGHFEVTSLTRAKPLRHFARLTLLAPACGRTRPENQERMTHWAASARTIQTQRSALGWQEPHGLLSTVGPLTEGKHGFNCARPCALPVCRQCRQLSCPGQLQSSQRSSLSLLRPTKEKQKKVPNRNVPTGTTEKQTKQKGCVARELNPDPLLGRQRC